MARDSKMVPNQRQNGYFDCVLHGENGGRYKGTVFYGVANGKKADLTKEFVFRASLIDDQSDDDRTSKAHEAVVKIVRRSHF